MIVVVPEEKLIAPLPVVVLIVIGLVARVTGPVITTPVAPLVVMLFLKEMLPVDVAESEVRGVLPPTTPVKVIVPKPAVNARFDAPLIVPPKEIAPFAALVFTAVVAAANVAGIPAAIENEFAMTLDAEAPKETPPGAAVTEKALRASIFPITPPKLTEPVAFKVRERAVVTELMVLAKLMFEPV